MRGAACHGLERLKQCLTGRGAFMITLSTLCRVAFAAVAAAAAGLAPFAAAYAGNEGPAKSDWTTYGRDYGQQRFSPLDEINVKTVQRLVPKWIYQTGAASTFSTSPLVADGVMRDPQSRS